MSSVNLDPIVIFDQTFPCELQGMMVEVLRSLYGESASATNSIVTGPHNKDLQPHVRRAMIEARLEKVAAGYSEITVRNETNRSGNTHVVIEGPNFILTESFVRSLSKVVRWAAYRNAHSLQNYPLFATIETPDDLQPEMKFNAVLLHGHRPHSKYELSFAVIRFPHPGFKAYLPDLINLLDRFPIVPIASEPDEMENIPDTIEPKILTDRPIRKDS